VADLVGERMVTTDLPLSLNAEAETPATKLAEFEGLLRSNIETATYGMDPQWHAEDERVKWQANPVIASFETGFVASAQDLRGWFVAEQNAIRAEAMLLGLDAQPALHLYLRASRSRYGDGVVGGTLYARFTNAEEPFYLSDRPPSLVALDTAAALARRRVQVPVAESLTGAKRRRNPEEEEGGPKRKKAK
jgi:hypothetical protein